jgi:hypothetical protein
MDTSTDGDILAACPGQAEREVIVRRIKLPAALTKKQVFFPFPRYRREFDLMNSTGGVRYQFSVCYIGIDADPVTRGKKTFNQGKHVRFHTAAAAELVMDNRNFQVAVFP